MDQNAHLRERTNEILRQKINLGMTGGIRGRSKNCAKGTHKVCKAGEGRSKNCAKGTRKVCKTNVMVKRRKAAGIMAAGCCEYCGGSGIMAGDGVLIGGRRKMQHKRTTGDGIKAGAGKRSGSKTRKVTKRAHKSSGNSWVNFLKDMVMETGEAYGQLMKDPEVRALYSSLF